MKALLERLTNGAVVLAWRETEDGGVVVVTENGCKRRFTRFEVEQARDGRSKNEPGKYHRSRPSAAG